MALAVIVFAPLSPDRFWYFVLERYGIGWTPRREWLVDVGGNVALFVPAGMLLAGGFRSAGRTRPWRDALIVAAAVAAGIELTQRVLAWRVADVQDAACNVLGAAIGVLLVRVLPRRPPAPPAGADRDP